MEDSVRRDRGNDYYVRCEIICMESKSISLGEFFSELLKIPFRVFVGMTEEDKEND